MTQRKAPLRLDDRARPRKPNEPKRRRLLLIDEADKEAALFFVRWLKAPNRIGAVAPSSKLLARAMAREVAGAGPGPIVELGGGTGSVTRALLEAGIAPERLIVVERDRKLHGLLAERFPALKVLHGDAGHLRRLLAPLGIKEAAAVVSSLPLISMPRHTRTRIIAESFALLGQGRPFVQFTYGPVSPIARREMGLAGKLAARVWANLPPASVWRYERIAGRERTRKIA